MKEIKKSEALRKKYEKLSSYIFLNYEIKSPKFENVVIKKSLFRTMFLYNKINYFHIIEILKDKFETDYELSYKFGVSKLDKIENFSLKN